MGLEDHPTVKNFRNRERTGQPWGPVPPQILESDELLKLALECGADDAGLVEISNPALDDQRAEILHRYPWTKSLVLLCACDNLRSLCVFP